MIKTYLFKNSHSVGIAAAQKLSEAIKAFTPTLNKPYLVLRLPTGSTPLPMYRELVRLRKEEGLSFKNVVTFNMDEYCDLPITHRESYHAFMFENLFKHIDIIPENIHILNGLAEDKENESARYESLIDACGGIDIQVGGIGSNGHIAFNEPGTAFDSKTHQVTLADQTRRDNARFFGGDINQVPKSALTIGLGTIMKAREVMILATGAGKAAAVAKSVQGIRSSTVPASVLQGHAHAYFYLDEAASAELK